MKPEDKRAPRKISAYGMMIGVHGRGTARLFDPRPLIEAVEVAAGFLGGDFTPLAHPADTHGAPVHPAAAVILSRQTKRRMLETRFVIPILHRARTMPMVRTSSA